MTKFDEIFDNATTTANIDWVFVYSNADRNISVDSKVYDYPCIFRAFRETVNPLFDNRQNVEREMMLYIVHVGFADETAEQLNENLQEIMDKFIIWREAMRRAGVEVTINGRPFPNWEQTDLDEYGYVFNLTVKYSLCL